VIRHCYRAGCRAAPVATLTYDYAHSAATLSPLSASDEPGGYDLCLEHARNLHVPSGWRLDRVSVPSRQKAGADWLDNLADEVRRIGWGDDPPEPQPDPAGVVELGRRGHLRVIADAADHR